MLLEIERDSGRTGSICFRKITVKEKKIKLKIQMPEMYSFLYKAVVMNWNSKVTKQFRCPLWIIKAAFDKVYESLYCCWKLVESFCRTTVLTGISESNSVFHKLRHLSRLPKSQCNSSSTRLLTIHMLTPRFRNLHWKCSCSSSLFLFTKGGILRKVLDRLNTGSCHDTSNPENTGVVVRTGEKQSTAVIVSIRGGVPDSSL